MGWNGNGIFNRLYSWVNDKNAGIDITSSRMDADTNDIVVGIENTRTLDGQNTPTANLPMGGFIHTGVGNATARNNYPAVGQIQDGALLFGGTSTGSANAQVIALTPTLTAYVAGQVFGFVAGFTNSSSMTLAVNAAAAKAVLSSSGVALIGTEIGVGNFIQVAYDGTNFRLISSPTIGVVKLVKFTAGGTYTPSPGLQFNIIECLGGGGGGGAATASSGLGAGGGGGAGSYSRKLSNSATPQTVTIGAGGASTVNGGDTSVGSLCVGKGGSAGNTAGANGTGSGGLGGVAGTGDIVGLGENGLGGPGGSISTVAIFSGAGGSTLLGSGGLGAYQAAGNAATGFGAGGSGGSSAGSTGSVGGGSGSSGIVIITEFCNQ